MANNNVLGWFLSRGQAKAVKSAALTSNPLTNWFYGWTPADGDYDPSYNGLMRAYLASLWAFRCATVRATTIASIPLVVKTLDDHYVDARGNVRDTPIRSKVEQHVLQRMIGESNRRMWRQIEYDRCIFGPGFLSISRKGLQRLNPYTMEVEKDAQGGITGFRQNVGGSIASSWKPKEIVYLYDYDPQDDFATLSPLMMALRAVASEVNMSEWVKAFFANDATPAGLLTTDQMLQEADLQRTEAWWKKFFGGVKNSHRTAIVGGGLHYEQISANPDNLAITDMRLEVRREVTAAFGVPMTIALADESANYSTSKDQHLVFYSETIIPQLETVVDALNEQLVPYFDDRHNLKIVADLSGVQVLQESKTEISARLTQGFGAGAYTLNEVRELEGYKTFDKDYINVPNVGLIMVDDLPKLAAANAAKFVAEAQAAAQPPAEMGYGEEPPTPPEAPPALPAPAAPSAPEAPISPSGDNGDEPGKALSSPFNRRAPGITYVDQYGDRKASPSADAGEAFVSIPLHAQELIDLQNRLKAELGDKAADWQRQHTLHMTLVYLPEIDGDLFKAVLNDIAPQSLDLMISGLGTFPDAGEGMPVYAAVVKSPQLEAYQRAVAEAFEAVGAALSPTTFPAVWTPHITLGYLSPTTSIPQMDVAFTVPAQSITFSRGDYQTVVEKQAVKSVPAIEYQLAIDDLKRWKKKVLSKGIKAAFDSPAIPPAIKGFLRWDLENAGDDREAIKRAFEVAEATIKSKDPTPEEFEEFWKGLDETAVDFQGLVADLLTDEDVKKRLAQRLEELGDIDTVLGEFFTGETERMVEALIGTEADPGPLARIYIAGAARGQELADKITPKPTPILAPHKAAVKPLQLSAAWDIVHRDAMAHAREYAYELVKGMNATTQLSFQDGMNAWVKQGGTLTTLVDFMMGRLKGLDIPEGWSDAKIKWATSRSRARTIAQTESVRAFSSGNHKRWEQLGVKDIKYRNQNDRIVCDFCKTMNNTVGTIKDGFPVPAQFQPKYGMRIKIPSHVGCRCFSSPLAASAQRPLEMISPKIKPKPQKPNSGKLSIGDGSFRR